MIKISQNSEKSALVIYSGRTARYLLKKGYTIIDVKADKINNLKSVFVFKIENNIEMDMKNFLNTERNELTKEMGIKNEKKNITKPEDN